MYNWFSCKQPMESSTCPSVVEENESSSVVEEKESSTITNVTEKTESSTSSSVVEEKESTSVVVDEGNEEFPFGIKPVTLGSDAECKELLEKIKSTLTLNDEESHLIDGCILVLEAVDGDDVHFGPGEILELALLASKNNSMSTEILACSQFLVESVDCEGEIPPGFFLKVALAYGSLNDIMASGSNSSNGSNSSGDSLDANETSDDESEANDNH